MDNLEAKQYIPFSYALDFSALPDAQTYAGYHIMCDLRDGSKLVHDFGKVAITPNPDGTGTALLNASTNDWPTGKLLIGDVVILDPSNQPIISSNAFSVTIGKTVTDLSAING